MFLNGYRLISKCISMEFPEVSKHGHHQPFQPYTHILNLKKIKTKTLVFFTVLKHKYLHFQLQEFAHGPFISSSKILLMLMSSFFYAVMSYSSFKDINPSCPIKFSLDLHSMSLLLKLSFSFH